MNTRQEFEDHCRSACLETTPHHKDKELYWYADTDAAWVAWQAATAKQDAKVKAFVKALEHALSWLKDKEPVPADGQNAIATAKEAS